MKPQPARPTLLLTVDEVAAELRVSRSTVEAWIAAGNLPSMKLGRLRRIRRDHLLALLEDRVAVPPPSPNPDPVDELRRVRAEHRERGPP